MSEIEKLLSIFERETAKMLDLVGILTEEQLDWRIPLGKDEESWSVRQIVAHIEEVNYFWYPQFKEALINPSTKLGRSAEDYVIRQTAVDKADSHDLSAQVENIKKSVPVIRAALGNMKDEQMDLEFPMKGVPDEESAKINIGFLISHVYPEHIDEHTQQIETILLDYSKNH
jgi:uncharacterized damage-inducible protein DinB